MSHGVYFDERLQIVSHGKRVTSHKVSSGISGNYLVMIMSVSLIMSGEVGGWGRTQKNVLGVFGGWGRVPFNEPYAPSLSTIYDGA